MKNTRILGVLLLGVMLSPLGVLHAESPTGSAEFRFPPVPPAIPGTYYNQQETSSVLTSSGANEISLESALEDANLSEFENYGEESCDSCAGSDHWLFRHFAPSDTCYNEYISPVTNPVYFEDPRTLSELRFMFIHQRLDPALNSGDSFQLYAMQIRAALTDRLSLVAAKDGFIVSDNTLLNDGWADISLGLKYNLYANPETRRLLSTGFAYQVPIGSTRTLQGDDDGEFHIYLSAATPIGCDWNWISGTGLRLPVDDADGSQMWYWSNHFDRQLWSECWYVFAETNWYHYMSSGNNGALNGVEGGDMINLGSTGVTGNDIVTGALGIKYRPTDSMEIGIAWEAPLTNRRDLLDNRLAFDWIIRY